VPAGKSKTLFLRFRFNVDEKRIQIRCKSLCFACVICFVRLKPLLHRLIKDTSVKLRPSCGTCSCINMISVIFSVISHHTFCAFLGAQTPRKETNPYPHVHSATLSYRFLSRVLVKYSSKDLLALLPCFTQQTSLECPSCKNSLPYCCTTGRHMV